jgi:hypothetical protein
MLDFSLSCLRLAIQSVAFLPFDETLRCNHELPFQSVPKKQQESVACEMLEPLEVTYLIETRVLLRVSRAILLATDSF